MPDPNTPIRRIMTRGVIRVSPETTIADAVSILRRNQITGAPVVEGQQVVGILSVSDLLGALEDSEQFRELEERTVAEVMTRSVLAVTREATVAEAAAAMVRHDVHRLVVVETDGSLAGILSTVDLLAYYAGQRKP